MDYFTLVIAAIFVNNIVLAQYLGNCPFIGTSKESGVAIGMGLAVVFVATMAAAITWCVQRFLLVPLDLAYLQTITFILVIASLVQFVEMFLKKVVPPLYKSLGIFLPLITTNCAVLGIAIICQREEYTLLETIVFSIASGAGFLLALVVLASIRERLDLARVPTCLRGTPLALIMAGLMSLAFFAFKGMAS
ncbi:RnfABCDGE type electron transport complex subunit A [Pseudodesulfovibrio sp. F-1]|uniref:Ion-translocating oxidoreductase complex subunit A n=1 Tax=Pseudodesulfovibrio alkaliphilus TaxID=2661613 RepID=A0A7K1KLV1_9BACT|nr:RnfABCDGE type electron transport complex subunit A [Pseudodesulfovibrio alkaliphilus]MUM77035.1 RnfABCDGE type electron transport complex subunit A [Pseudodesulfovibrio alkaliphilus]